MDFNQRIEQLEARQRALSDEISSCRTSLAAAEEFTAKFLDSCGMAGLTKVSIAKRHKSIVETMGHPFGVTGSVFGIGPKSSGGGRDPSGWPAIWGVVDELGIGDGCGNSMQHQADTSSLIDGVYHLKNGVWEKVDTSEGT